MHSSWRTLRRASLPASSLAVVLALTACGSGGSKSGASAGGVAGTTTALGGAAGAQVVATETDYKIQLSTMALKPGRTTFVALNKGHVAHSLEIDGPGVSNKRIGGTVSPGASKRLTVTLQKGKYEIYCPVPGHKQLGMDLHVTVGGHGGGAMMHAGTTTTTGGTTTSGGGGGGGY
jgi:uncharacterized cupredoxin-like copper-binding protein